MTEDDYRILGEYFQNGNFAFRNEEFTCVTDNLITCEWCAFTTAEGKLGSCKLNYVDDKDIEEFIKSDFPEYFI